MATICQDHWNRLRRALEDRGLKVLISESGQEAAMKELRAGEEGYNIDNFDPLMGASNRILINALELVGLEVIAQPGCAICWMNKEHEENCEGPPCVLPRENAFDDWIDKAADGALETWESFRE